MKRRIISLKVTCGDSILFEKSPSSPQDLISACALYERDGLVVSVCFNDVDDGQEKE